MALLAPAQPLRAAGVPGPAPFNPVVSLTAGAAGTGADVIAAGGGNVLAVSGAPLRQGD